MDNSIVLAEFEAAPLPCWRGQGNYRVGGLRVKSIHSVTLIASVLYHNPSA